MAGVVARSGDARYAEGDKVVVTGFGLGEEHDGGFADYVRVPADWLVPLPDGHEPARVHGARYGRLHRGAGRGRHAAQRPDTRTSARCW